MKRIYINISDIPTYVGKSKYDLQRPIERLWCKYDKDDYESFKKNCENVVMKKVYDIDIDDKDIENEKTRKTLIEKMKITEKDETKVNEIINEKITELKKRVETFKYTDAELIQKELNSNVFKKSDIETIQNPVIKEKAQTFFNKNKGIQNEDSALNSFESDSKLKLDKEQKYYSKFLFNYNNKDWYIGGKMDGIDHENQTIIEVKTRMRCFFNNVRDYEMAQIQLYMYISGYKKSILVEKLNKKIKKTNIEYNEDYVNTLLFDLKTFIQSFDLFMNTLDTKENYVSSDNEDKNNILNELFF
jgi:hypothetical protein